MKKVNSLVLVLVFFFAMASCSEAQNSKSGIAKDVNIEEFNKKASEEGVILIDVRTQEEVNQGKLKGAINIDFFDADFEKELDKLDKSKSYAVYCKSGGRSGKTLKMMNKKGFTEVYNLLGGYDGWHGKGMPTE